VCLFTASLEPSGLGEHMLALARELRSRFRILLACLASPGGESLLGRARGMGLETLMLNERESEADALGRWLRSQRVQLFHDHAGIGWEGHQGIYAARRAGIGAIVRTEHLPYLLTEPAQREAHRRLVASVDQLICVSDGAQQEFIKAGIPLEKLRVVRNGISPPPARQASRLQVRQRLGLPSEARIVLTVARLEHQKGHLHLLAAIPSVRARHPDTYFVWVGEGTLHSELREKLHEQGSDGFVRMVGSRSDVADLMGGSDVLVLPSLFEGLPLVILEAMSIGLPVVGTNVCGTAEAIEDGVTGRLVPPRDPLALAASIVDVLDQPGLASARAEAARQRVEQEFSARRMGQEVARVYMEVLSRITP
jgi:glycosyltransferase involved in cell wall biosynthesis